MWPELLISVLLVAQGYIVPGRPRAGGAPCTVPDETAFFQAVWNIEQASDSTRTAESASVCGAAGSDCDLASTNTTTKNTTQFVEGTASVAMTDAGNGELSCNFSTGCDELMYGDDTSFAIGGFIYMDTDVGNANFYEAFNSPSGWMLRYIAASDTMQIRIGDGTDVVNTTGATDAVVEDTWYYTAVDYDGSTNTATLYINEATSTDATQIYDDPGSGNWQIGNSGAAGHDGSVDHSYSVGATLSAAEHCFICSCMINNEEGCTSLGADPSAFDDKGANSSRCGSCTMPTNACNPIS